MRSRCVTGCSCLTGMAALMLCSLLQVMDKDTHSLGGVGGWVEGGLLTPLCSAANHSLHMHEAQLPQLPHI